MLEIGYVAAFLGGVLSLLSPCSALLLPAFFAYAFSDPLVLLKRTAVFTAGLASLLVPLGLGIAALSRLVNQHRPTLIVGAGVVLIVLGALQSAGKGLGFAPAARAQQQLVGEGAGSVFLLGATYGFAGFCSGPILGAVLTVAAASGDPAAGAGLLAVYALGMAAPLFLLALLWDRLGLRRRSRLRGRALAIGPLHVHSGNLVAGLLFVALGVLFIVTEGTAGLSSLYGPGATELAFRLNETVLAATRAVPDLLVVAVLGAAGLWGGHGLRRRRTASREPVIGAADASAGGR